MIRILLVALLSIGVFAPIYGQDDLLSILEKEREDDLPVFATFKTIRIINSQSVELTAPGVLNFIIGHRFGKLNDGAYQLFGLDQATIRLGFEYGISNKLMIGLGRSSFRKTFDGSLKYKLISQTNVGGFPLSVVYYTGLSLNTLRESDPERDNQFASRMSYFYQVMLAHKFSPDLSLQFSPTLIHRNLVATASEPNDVFALGIGGRYKLSNRLSINGEYFYRLSESLSDLTFNSVAIGLDIETGGHVFQVHITNSQGMVENYFVADTNGDISNGDIYFGFNINRVFHLRKKDKQ